RYGRSSAFRAPWNKRKPEDEMLRAGRRFAIVAGECAERFQRESRGLDDHLAVFYADAMNIGQNGTQRGTRIRGRGIHAPRGNHAGQGEQQHPYCTVMFTAFDGLPPAVTTTSTMPLPATPLGIRMLYWSSPAYVPCGPAYA